jgi:hypothetical protein
VLNVLIPAFSSVDLLRVQLTAIRKFIPRANVWVCVDTNYSGFGLKRKRMKSVADNLADHVIPFPQVLHWNRRILFPNSKQIISRSPSLRHADVLQYSYQIISRDKGAQILILDEDLLPFKPWRLPANATDSKPIFIVPQSRSGGDLTYVYPWPGFFYADLARTNFNELISWDAPVLSDVRLDSGGSMHSWITKNLDGISVVKSNHSGQWSLETVHHKFPQEIVEFLEKDKLENGFQYSELYADTFIHLRGRSNWQRNNRKQHNQRIRNFCQSIEKITSG